MKGGFAGWLFDEAVWVLASTEIISATKWEVGCECEQSLARQLTPKSRALSFRRSTRRAPGILSCLGKLQEPGAYSASGVNSLCELHVISAV